MKYFDAKILFYTEEQNRLTRELRDEIPFADMQVRVARFYVQPLAITVNMEDGKVMGSILYFYENLRLLSPQPPQEIHDIIEKSFG